VAAPAERTTTESSNDATLWHVLPAQEVAARLKVDPKHGLTSNDAADRLQRYGPNEMAEGERRSPLGIFFGQFTDFLILVLIAAAIVSGIVGDLKDTALIAVIVILNAIIGFVQEYQADRAVAALKAMAAPMASVMRDSRPAQIPAAHLVPGDVVLLDAGTAVPADLRLVEAAHLKINEAALTGESVPVDKQIEPSDGADLAIADRRNLAYRGTTATYGRARGVVIATGMETELGKIAGMLGESREPKTPLQTRIARFGRVLGIAILGVCVVIFAAGLLRGENALLMFLTAISVAVAAIPESLPAVVTILLALGARRMSQRRALVRRLPATETLGSVTFICVDKTGTITENQMRAESVVAPGAPDVRPESPGEPFYSLFRAMALCTDVLERAEDGLAGDPTEVALWEAAAAHGFDVPALREEMPRRFEFPFDSERKRMTTGHVVDGQIVAYTKGAPETVIPLCTTMLGLDGPVTIDHDDVLAMAERIAAEGYRVMAFASRPWDSAPTKASAEAVEADLMLLGLVGLMDPPRAEAAQAVAECLSAGITPVMITGDHPATARAIAERVGILQPGDGSMITGADLAGLSDEELFERVDQLRVYARVDPSQKVRIVEALQARGQYVAMTGDGVNDSPALKRANIGVAMGKVGTDAAREASSLILLDDNFATIVAAVREGRRLYDNIRKFIKYAVTTNSAEVSTILLAPLLGLPLPLLPIHILWINLLTDGLPGLALAAEPAARNIMQRPPRAPNESIFANGMWQHMIWVGLTMAGVTILIQAAAIDGGDRHWQTMVFTTLTLAQMANIMAIRSERESLFTLGLRSNMPLLGAVLLTCVLQLAVVYIPPLNEVFNTQALSPAELAVCFAAAGSIFVAVEIEKLLVRRGLIYQAAAANSLTTSSSLTWSKRP
jgi:Ca2+-transporting ATPase